MKKSELMKSLDELIKGEMLKDPLPLDYARQVAGALEAAHETGIAHSV
jgi:hypothetical protein